MKRNVFKILFGKPEQKDTLEDLDADGRTKLKYTLSVLSLNDISLIVCNKRTKSNIIIIN
jgi:hypothetical protein